MAFAARYPGQCDGCEDPIKIGDDITMVGGRAMHEECAPNAYAGKAETVCPKCFLTSCDC